MKIVFEKFKKGDGTSPEFNNPHNWTQEDLSEAYSVINEKFSMAWSIKLMALSHHLSQGPASVEIGKLKSESGGKS